MPIMFEPPATAAKIVIVGAGAMGSIYAGFFAEAGHSVAVVDIWAEHISAIARAGLRLEGASGDRVVPGIGAFRTVEEAGPGDLFVIATKANGVGQAAASIAKVTTPKSLVLTIQNGLGASDRIAQHMATDNVLLGVAEGFGAARRRRRPTPTRAVVDSLCVSCCN